jgi:hypothetical protein
MPAKKTASRKKTTRKKLSKAKGAPRRRKTTSRKKTTPRKETRKYGAGAAKKVKRAMDEMKRGELQSGRSGKKVTSRKQAIAIGLSEARKEGAKVPKKRS